MVFDMFGLHIDIMGRDLRLLGEKLSTRSWHITHMKFRAAFNWGKVLGRTFRGHGRAALVAAKAACKAKWARLERCAVTVHRSIVIHGSRIFKTPLPASSRQMESVLTDFGTDVAACCEDCLHGSCFVL